MMRNQRSIDSSEDDDQTFEQCNLHDIQISFFLML